MDIEKYNALAALVLEAREADKAALEEMNAATAKWKAANATLTERLKVFDGYLTQCKNEDTLAETAPKEQGA